MAYMTSSKTSSGSKSKLFLLAKASGLSSRVGNSEWVIRVLKLEDLTQRLGLWESRDQELRNRRSSLAVQISTLVMGDRYHHTSIHESAFKAARRRLGYQVLRQAPHCSTNDSWFVKWFISFFLCRWVDTPVRLYRPSIVSEKPRCFTAARHQTPIAK